MKQLSKYIFILIIAIATNIYAAEGRDPFTPYTHPAPSANTNNLITPAKPENPSAPLVDKPLSAYIVAGVVVSPKRAIAVIKSRDKREYFAYIGDKVGMEGGVIETINIDGIIVDMGGKAIPMKVSNKFENQDDKPETK